MSISPASSEVGSLKSRLVPPNANGDGDTSSSAASSTVGAGSSAGSGSSNAGSCASGSRSNLARLENALHKRATQTPQSNGTCGNKPNKPTYWKDREDKDGCCADQDMNWRQATPPHADGKASSSSSSPSSQQPSSSSSVVVSSTSSAPVVSVAGKFSSGTKRGIADKDTNWRKHQQRPGGNNSPQRQSWKAGKKNNRKNG